MIFYGTLTAYISYCQKNVTVEMESQTSLLGTVDQQVSRYKHVLNIMPAGVILLNPHGLIAEANQKLTGYWANLLKMSVGWM